MANTLTDLAGDIYVAADVVSRELVGAVPSVMLNTGSEGVALNGTVRSHATRAATAGDNTPAMTIPEGTDQVVDNKTMTINKSRGVPIPMTGEDIKHLNNGSGYSTIYGDQIAQAMRTLANEMEVDLCTALRAGASRAYGTAGTAPFGTAGNFTDLSYGLKILEDNGAPLNDVSAILNTTSGANLLGFQSQANMQAQDTMLRQGVIVDHMGTMIRKSAQLADHTAGTGTSYTSSTAGHAVGSTDIAIITGSGTVVAGDLVTFAGDSEKYLVTVGVAAPGTITIAEPGLRTALPTSAVAMTIVGDSATNIILPRSAAEIAIRPPAKPVDGDAAVDSMIVVDPRSGIPFDISVYKGFQKQMINVSAAWGVKAWKTEHIGLILG